VNQSGYWSRVAVACLVPVAACVGGCARLSGGELLNNSTHSGCLPSNDASEVEILPKANGNATFIDATTHLRFLLRSEHQELRNELLFSIENEFQDNHEDRSNKPAPRSGGEVSVFNAPLQAKGGYAFYAVLESVKNLGSRSEIPSNCETQTCDLPAAEGETTSGFAVFAEDATQTIVPFETAWRSRDLQVEYKVLSGDLVSQKLCDAIFAANSDSHLGGFTCEGETQEDSESESHGELPDSEDTGVPPAYYLVRESSPSGGNSLRPVGIVLNAPRVSPKIQLDLQDDSVAKQDNYVDQEQSRARCLDVATGYTPQILLFPGVLPQSPSETDGSGK
jgi:hypothetical protein